MRKVNSKDGEEDDFMRKVVRFNRELLEAKDFASGNVLLHYKTDKLIPCRR